MELLTIDNRMRSGELLKNLQMKQSVQLTTPHPAHPHPVLYLHLST